MRFPLWRAVSVRESCWFPLCNVRTTSIVVGPSRSQTRQTTMMVARGGAASMLCARSMAVALTT